VFCFVDQNPKGMRSSLYVKDEDYRFSFLYGNYVTLTHVRDADLERIVAQRLSPLYVSIHATNAAVRRRLLGIEKDDGLLDKIHVLCEAGIVLHGQIVLCPGINDGDVLNRSIDVLSTYYPSLRSLSVVPVGLTRYRQDRVLLQRVDGRMASEVLQKVMPIQDRFLDALGEPFVYLSDEWYLLADAALPPEAHYGDFWQVENGVGLTRAFLADFENALSAVPESGDERRYVLVTGTLAEPVLRRHVIPRLRAIGHLEVDVRAVPNRFYGDSVTVSGLLTGGDIRDAFREEERDTVLCLPPNCLNADGLFLDDATPNTLSEDLGRPVMVLDNWTDLWSVCR
jgi:putative radical SAM enzyme (TIGR03279 family)